MYYYIIFRVLNKILFITNLQIKIYYQKSHKNYDAIIVLD